LFGITYYYTIYFTKFKNFQLYNIPEFEELELLVCIVLSIFARKRISKFIDDNYPKVISNKSNKRLRKIFNTNKIEMESYLQCMLVMITSISLALIKTYSA